MAAKASLLKDPLSWRYPALEPYASGMLQVSPLHTLYYEVCGNPNGKPVVFLHGGPGGGIEANHRCYFNPEAYRIVLFDQRGAGRSTPHASLDENTTWHLVDDIEALRRHLNIERWQVFGGSWGSTLALAYSEAHPARVTELVLRGIFLGRQSEIDWLYQGGAGQIFPDAFAVYQEPIPAAERHDFVTAFHRRLTGTNLEEQLRAAVAWSAWEGSVTKLIPDADYLSHFADPHFALAFARIESHYFHHKLFLSSDNQLIEQLGRIRHIPAVIVHGRYDVCCPMQSAWDLHRAWPEAELMIVPDSGHSAFEPGISRALVAATDKFATRLAL